MCVDHVSIRIIKELLVLSFQKFIIISIIVALPFTTIFSHHSRRFKTAFVTVKQGSYNSKSNSIFRHSTSRRLSSFLFLQLTFITSTIKLQTLSVAQLPNTFKIKNAAIMKVRSSMSCCFNSWLLRVDCIGCKMNFLNHIVEI